MLTVIAINKTIRAAMNTILKGNTVPMIDQRITDYFL